MKRLNEFDGIVFDMDGVIFDTERIGLESWRIVADKYGLENIEEAVRRCMGRNVADSMVILQDMFGDTVDVAKLKPETNTVFHSILKERGLPVKKGARELLEFLKENGVTFGLASSTNYEVVTEQLTKAGLIDYFKVIIGGNMVEHSKPEPEIYLMACEKLNFDPKNTYAVEDSYNGLLSASRAGMMTVLVPDLFEPSKEMLELADEKFEDLDKLREELS